MLFVAIPNQTVLTSKPLLHESFGRKSTQHTAKCSKTKMAACPNISLVPPSICSKPLYYLYCLSVVSEAYWSAANVSSQLADL